MPNAKLLKLKSEQPLLGIDYLAVPCSEASDADMAALHPVYLGPGNGEVPDRYICPRCARTFVRRHSCALHMGLIANMGSTCLGGR